MKVADQHSVQCKGSAQASLSVRIYPEFVNSLPTPLESGVERRSPAESGGLLFGTTEEGLVTLRAFSPFAIWEQHQNNSPKLEEIDKAAGELSGSFSAEPDLRNSELVGWCYVRQAGSKGLLERDIRFHNRHFRCATDLMLILNAGQGQDVSIELFAPDSNVPLSQEEFRWGSFHLSTGHPLTRPLDVNLEGRHERDHLGSPQLAVSAASEVPAKTLELSPEVPAPRTNRLRLLLSAALFVFAIVMTFACAHTLAQYLAFTPDSRSVLHRSVQSPDLRMQAENNGDGILLSWNRHAAAAQSAKQGILHIQDGSEQRTIYLDPSDVANSSIVYRPDSSDASFLLEILGEHGSTMSNRVRSHDRLKSIAGPDKPDSTPDVAVRGEKAAPTGNPKALPNYVPARALKQVLPSKKFFASWEVRERTRVDVQVRIDETGRVIEAHVKNGTQDNGLLHNATLDAAKQWIFEPAKSDGKNIPSDHTIEFQFHP